jgi:hypothetical protein
MPGDAGADEVSADSRFAQVERMLVSMRPASIFREIEDVVDDRQQRVAESRIVAA